MATETDETLPAPTIDSGELARRVRDLAHRLVPGDLTTYDPLIDLVGDARIVLIGDGSHGTHEFYRERALITTRLIEEKDFTMVAVEGDWPEGYRIDEFLQGGPGTARHALGVFEHYPTWMWGNQDFLHFVDWLRRHNDAVDAAKKVRFFGIDVRSVYEAGRMVVEYLVGVDPNLAAEVEQRLSCFEHFTGGVRDAYGKRAEMGITGRCEEEAIAVLERVRHERNRLVAAGGEERYFHVLQAATVVRNGERFYEAAGRKDRDASWNIRDIHMMDALDALLEHYGNPKVVIWEHNTHVGDFRATGNAGEKVNIGQLVRERRPGQSIAVGFGTYEGTVTATREWGEQPQHMDVPPAQPDSYDGVFHETGLDRFLLPLRRLEEDDRAELNEWRGQRAIGVVYKPEDESENFVPTRLADRYDAYVHVDRTTAIRPLREEPTWQSPVTMDTYPSGY